jgi:hypothetical protein
MHQFCFWTFPVKFVLVIYTFILFVWSVGSLVPFSISLSLSLSLSLHVDDIYIYIH